MVLSLVTVTLPEQVFVPSSRDRRRVPRPDRMDPVTGERGAGFKPGGGIWTSTWKTAHEEGWPWWLRAENLHTDPRWTPEKHGYVLRPKEARVFEVHDAGDVDELCDRWGQGSGELGGTWDWYFDWIAFVQEADALRCVNPYDWHIRYSHRTTLFYGWDAESTWWSRWLFTGRPKRVELFP